MAALLLTLLLLVATRDCSADLLPVPVEGAPSRSIPMEATRASASAIFVLRLLLLPAGGPAFVRMLHPSALLLHRRPRQLGPAGFSARPPDLHHPPPAALPRRGRPPDGFCCFRSQTRSQRPTATVGCSRSPSIAVRRHVHPPTALSSQNRPRCAWVAPPFGPCWPPCAHITVWAVLLVRGLLG
jgi:hypothetical protein